MWMCSAMRSNASGAARVNLSYPTGRGVLMAFAMALNREGDSKEMYARDFPSVLQDASFAEACCRAAFRGPALPCNATQLLCEALSAGTEPSSSAEAAPTA